MRNVLLFPGRGCAYVIYGRYERVLCMRGSSLNHASSVDDIITLKTLTISMNSTENITARSVFGSLHVLISSFVKLKLISVSGSSLSLLKRERGKEFKLRSRMVLPFWPVLYSL